MCVKRGAVFRRLVALASPFGPRLLVAGLLIAVTSVLALVPAQITRLLVNQVLVPRKHLDELLTLLAVLLATQIVQAVVSAAHARVTNRFGYQLVGAIRAELWTSLQRLSLRYFVSVQGGVLGSGGTERTAGWHGSGR